jgi:hypothetical protein
MVNETDAPKTPKKAGRPRGSLNRRSELAREICARLNCDPLEALLRMVKNKRLAIDVRLSAAAAAVGFCHPRLSTSFIASRSENTTSVRLQMHEILKDPKLAAAAELLSLQLDAQNQAGTIIDATVLALPEGQESQLTDEGADRRKY